jgi:ApbE superfamily uncharacterized protein (UPF0280 family)
LLNLPYKIHFTEKESDITIISESKAAILRAKNVFHHERKILERYILRNKKFLESFTPIKVNSNLKIIKIMAEAAERCNVGPMAAVAGAFSDIMLESMKEKGISDFIPAKNALVEDGGEIAIDSEKPIKVALYSGSIDLGLNIGFLIQKTDCPLGIATSSATIGHAISFGQADSVTIFADTAALADAAATMICNLVIGSDIEKSIKKGLDTIDDLDGIRGAIISRDNRIGQVGKIPQLIKIEGQKEEIIKKKIAFLFPGDYTIFK